MKIQLVVQEDTIKELVQAHIESLVTIKDSAEVELTFTKHGDVIVDISTGTNTTPKKEKVVKETKKEVEEKPTEDLEEDPDTEEPTLGNNPLFKEPTKEKGEEKKSSPAQGLFAKLSQANNK